MGSLGLFVREERRLATEQAHRARLEAQDDFEAFRDEVFQVNYLLNTRPPNRDELTQGIAACESALDRYGALADLDWKNDPKYQLLSTPHRTELDRTVGELFLLLARGKAITAGPGDPARAAERLRASLKLNRRAESTFPAGELPRSLWSQRAEFLTAVGEKEAGRDAAERAESTPPASAADRYALARDQVMQGNLRRAIALLDTATRQDPKHFWSWFLMGYCHHTLVQDDDAIRCYTCCIALRPDFYPSYLDRALVYSRQKNHVRAKADFDTVIGFNPSETGAYLDRALARDSLSDRKGAIADLDHVIAAGDAPTRAYFLRARLRERSGDLEGAQRDRQEGLKKEPTDIKSWLARGYALSPQDPERALEDYRKALELDPRSLPALQNCASVLSERLNRPREALQYLDRALEIYPDYLPASQGRGVLRARMGMRAEAIEDLEKALGQDSTPRTRYYAACVYALTSQSEPADRLRAFHHLRAALRGGFGMSYIEKDTDLDAIRDSAEFRNIVKASQILRID